MFISHLGVVVTKKEVYYGQTQVKAADMPYTDLCNNCNRFLAFPVQQYG